MGEVQLFYNDVAKVLVQEAFCSTIEEAVAVIESLQIDDDDDDVLTTTTKDDDRSTTTLKHQRMIQLLAEYLDVSCDMIHTAVNKCDASEATTKRQSRHSDRHDSDVDESDNDEESSPKGLSMDDDDDDDDIIGPGECVLCERHMKLTRHHLIPKSTWNRLESRIASMVMLSSTSSTIQQTQPSQQLCKNDDYDSCFRHILPSIQDAMLAMSDSKKKPSTNNILTIVRGCVLKHQTIDICRPCHSHIHSSYDNMTLATQYNTYDKLIQNHTIYKFAQWAHHQRCSTGKVAPIHQKSKYK